MTDHNPWKPPADGREPHGTPSVPAAPASGADQPVLPPAAPVVPPPPPAAAPVVPPPVAPTDTPAVAPTDWTPSSDPLVGPDTVIVQTGEPPTRSRRSKWLVGAAAGAVVAVGAASVFAVSNLTGSVQGGAASPDELGLTLLQAIENEDVLGVVDVLSPGERDVFRDPLVDLVSELTRLEVLSEDADLSRILGVDVEFSNESVTATSTNVPDITNIDLRADAVLSLDGAELPIGDLITDNVPDDVLTEMRGTRFTETDELDVRFTAVEENGRWYFSVFHTIAELVREEAAPGSLIPVQGIGADGAESPEQAIDRVLDRIQALDLTGLLRTLNPGEAAALQRYAPLFLEEAEAALDELPLTWEITKREYRVDESGDSATVFLDALEIEGIVEGESFFLSYADGCVVVEGGGESFEQCENDPFTDDTGFIEQSPNIEQLITTVTEALSDIEEVGMELRRTDGLWYVSPIASFTEAGLAFLRALDRSELDDIIEQAPAAGDDLVELFFGALSGAPGIIDDSYEGTYTTDDSASDEILDVLDAIDSLDVDPGTLAGGTIEPGTWETCYGEFDAAVATACFDKAVVAGEIEASEVPLILRFPECGYSVAWGGGVYNLPDDEFVAAATASRDCFLGLVEQGEIDAFELPTEIANLECFEGRNWYNVYDDPEYDDRYYQCLESAYSR